MQRTPNPMRFGQNTENKKRGKKNIVIAGVAFAAVAMAVLLIVFANTGASKEVTSKVLPCYSSQKVTVFGENLLYYDNVTIHCISPTGQSRWTFTLGSGASFYASDDYVVAWIGSQLYIIDKKGNPTYNENMPSDVQFARIGQKYCAIVCGGDTEPDLIIRDVNGIQVDEEIEAFSGYMLLDVGFYGDSEQYMWVLSIDVYGTAINTRLNAFNIGKMNMGQVSLGENLAYKVLFESSRLRIFTTQQLYTYDYAASSTSSPDMLVYGWRYVGSHIPQRGDALMLLAPTSQLGANQSISDLRLLTNTTDRRYVLPSECVGAAVDGNYIYGISSDYLYRVAAGKSAVSKFTAFNMNLPQGVVPTSFIGLTSSGYAIITSGERVYSVSLPQ